MLYDNTPGPRPLLYNRVTSAAPRSPGGDTTSTVTGRGSVRPMACSKATRVPPHLRTPAAPVRAQMFDVEFGEDAPRHGRGDVEAAHVGRRARELLRALEGPISRGESSKRDGRGACSVLRSTSSPTAKRTGTQVVKSRLKCAFVICGKRQSAFTG
jgi:hypothetical protein